MSAMVAREVIEQQQLHGIFGESDEEEDFFGFENPGDISDIEFEGVTSESHDEESDESDDER